MASRRTTLDCRFTRKTAIGGIFSLLILHSIYKHSFQPKARDTTKYPIVKQLYAHEVYWELPSKSYSPLKGILLFLHGCNHAASDLWPTSTQCPTCLGLPEEQRIRKLALHHHSLVVIAISSLEATQQGLGCWNSRHLGTTPGHNDLVSIAAILENIVTAHEPQLQKLPIYALGVSSGGSIALILPEVMQLTGICAQIMAIDPQDLENIISSSSSSDTANASSHHTNTKLQLGKRFKYPPTVFMHMPRDVHTATYVEKDASILQSKNIPVAVMETKPRALSPNFLTHHSDGQISHDLAVGIVGALRHNKLVNAQGFLVKDPRSSREEWVAAVEPVTENFISLEPSRSPLMTLMNVAFAGHDVITSGLDSGLKWLESGGQGDLVKWLAEEEAAENKN